MQPSPTNVLVTGATGNAGQAICRVLSGADYKIRMADTAPPRPEDRELGEFVRCDMRTPEDVRHAVAGMDVVVHLAAWHSAHVPPVSDATIFAVNVDGTFNILEACREAGVQSVVYASSMAYGWGSVYSVTKVIGEELCRSYHEMTGMSIVMLRYHCFVPSTYLQYGAMMLRNGVDRRDVAAATLAATQAAREGRVKLFKTIVHSNHGMPIEVVENFAQYGPDWCESCVPGAKLLLAKYKIAFPPRVEQHDMSEALGALGWSPKIGFPDFLRDLKSRDAAGQDVTCLWVPGELPNAAKS